MWNYCSWVCLWWIDLSLRGISRSKIGINDIRCEVIQKAKTKTLVSVRARLHCVKKKNKPIYGIVSMNPIERVLGKPLSG